MQAVNRNFSLFRKAQLSTADAWIHQPNGSGDPSQNNGQHVPLKIM